MISIGGASIRAILILAVFLRGVRSTATSDEIIGGSGSIGYGIGGYGGSFGGIGPGIGSRLGFGSGLGGIGSGSLGLNAGHLGYGSGLGGTRSFSSSYGDVGSDISDLGGTNAGIVDLVGYGGYDGGSLGYGGYGGGGGGYGGYGGYGGGGYGGYGGYGGGGYGGFGGYGGYGGHGRGYGGYDGGLEKSDFSKGGESVNNGAYQNEKGHKGQSSSRLAEGLSAGQLAAKDAKGSSGYYTDAGGVTSGYVDKKSFGGGSHYEQKGSKGAEDKAATGHKKGHATNGFETSHHKDENGKTTTFYDVANDEGDHYDYGGTRGAFGDQGNNYYSGGYQDEKYNEGGHGHKGHYDKGVKSEKENGDKLAYGNQVYYGNNGQYGEVGGNDRASILGHSEASKYYKGHPSYY